MLKIRIIDTHHQNAYLFDNGETTLQIDMGVPFKKLEKIPDFVIYTHKHKDHFTNSKTYRKKTNVVDFDKKNQAHRLGSFYIQSIPLKHGKEWVNGFIIRDMARSEIYVFAIDFSDYRELAKVASMYSKAYLEPITMIMCELHHSESCLLSHPMEVSWAARRHCSDVLFLDFLSNFDKNKLKLVIATHTNKSLFDFFALKTDIHISFARQGASFNMY